MNKHQVTVNGQVFKRNSKTRQYTHALVHVMKRDWYGKEHNPPLVGCNSWAGSQDLAYKEIQTRMNRMAKNRNRGSQTDIAYLAIVNGAEVTINLETGAVTYK